MKKPKSIALLLFSIAIIFGLTAATKSLVDPTRPPPSQIQPTDGVVQPKQLTAIFIYPSYRIAIINGQAVKIGSRFGEYIVTSITPFTVELTGSRNTKEVLRLVTSVKRVRINRDKIDARVCSN